MNSTDSVVLTPTQGAGGGIGLQALREYFRYHGILAPGVKLLRALSFQVKAGIVTLAFLAPLLALSVQYTLQSREALAHTRSAMVGVRFAQDVQALTEAVQADRRHIFLAMAASSAPRDPNLRQRIEQAYAAVNAQYEASGEAFGLADAFHQVRQRHAGIADAGGPSTVDHLQSRLDYLQALQALQSAVVRGSGMQRATDSDLHDAQTLALAVLPPLVSNLAALGGHGALLLSGQKDTTSQAKVHAGLALVLEIQAQYIALQRGLAARPQANAALAQPLNGWKNVDAFIAESRLVAGELNGDGNAYLASAELAIQAAQEGQRQVMSTLAQMLQAREHEIEGRRDLLLGFVVACLALAIYVLMAFFRVMSGGLRQIQGQVDRMAQGDLSLRPAPLGCDEVAIALNGLGISVARLAELFATVRQGVSAVSFASNEIAKGNTDLTRRTELSTQSVRQVVQGVSRYIEQLDESGQRVDTAVQAVEALRLDATRSRTHMEKLQERMRALQGKSREIGEIVELIDGIAFRTNILALNASVEAAKAGEAGRGFAVVAQEVRSLAMRSAESARQITDIIARSTEDIRQGSELAEHAGQTLRETDDHVSRIHQAMNNIVTLTRSGQSNSQDILREIRELGDLAGENTKLVEQMASAASALSEHGEALDQKVATFKLA
jgi:methyl-accepting chemotaxis protein I, serine sensor receptor